MVFFIANPSFLRRLKFKHTEISCVYGVDNNSSYGDGTIDDKSLNKYMEADSLLFNVAAGDINKMTDVNKARDFVAKLVSSQRPDIILTDKAA